MKQWKESGPTSRPSAKWKLNHPKLYIGETSGNAKFAQTGRSTRVFDPIEGSEVIGAPLSKCMGISERPVV